MKMKSIKKNYIYNLIYNLSNLFIPLIVAPYLSRVLGVEGVGIKSYTLSIVSNFIIFASLGIAEYGQREIAINRDNIYERSKKLYEIGLLRIVTTILVTIIYSITFALPILNTSYNAIYNILIINIIANMLDFAWYLQGIEEFKFISFTQTLTKIVMLILTFTCVKEASDINIAILINSIVLLLNSIIPLYLVIKNVCKVKIKELHPLSHFKQCIVYFIPAIATQIYTVLDKTMIGLITNSTYENGYYEQADKMLKIIITFITTANVIMKSRISYLFGLNKIDEIKALISKSLHMTLMLAWPVMAGVIAIASVLVPIFFGDGYEKTINLLIILSPLALAIGISNLLGTHYLTPSGRRNKSNIGLIIGACVNFLLNMFLIKVLGAIGAAISSVAAESVITIMYIWLSKNVISVKDIMKTSYKYCIASVIMFILIEILKQKMQNSVQTLVILIGIGVTSYGVSLIILKDSFLYESIMEIIITKILNKKQKGRNKECK